MDVQELLNDLETGNNQRRRAASYKLGKLKDTSAVLGLIQAYSDTDPVVRRNVVEALQAIGTEEALDFLQKVKSATSGLPADRKGMQVSGYASSSYSSSSYIALRGVAKLAKVLGSLMVALAGVVFWGGGIILEESVPLGFSIIVFSIVFGVISYIAFRLIAEGILVFLDIESNTRHTAVNTRIVAEMLKKQIELDFNQVDN